MRLNPSTEIKFNYRSADIKLCFSYASNKNRIRLRFRRDFLKGLITKFQFLTLSFLLNDNNCAVNQTFKVFQLIEAWKMQDVQDKKIPLTGKIPHKMKLLIDHTRFCMGGMHQYF